MFVTSITFITERACISALASLALSVIIHPSLTPRVVLTAIFTSLLTLLVFFFYFVPKFHSWLLHPTLRFCTSSNGAFGLVLSVSLLLQPRIDAWANVWERLWVQDGDNWGTSKEKGLSAAFCAFLAVGIAVDWALRRWLGECPDEVCLYDLVCFHHLISSCDRNGTIICPIIWLISPIKRTEPGYSSLQRASGTVSSQRAINTILFSSLPTQILKLPHSHHSNSGIFLPHHRHLLSAVSSRKGVPPRPTNVAFKIQTHGNASP